MENQIEEKVEHERDIGLASMRMTYIDYLADFLALVASALGRWV